ncbi:uncharacterized protein LOC143356978 [Halictus rubicundus]|uniref:uncharacterized protein LOC143356978 n=1 Tax=Halictus rubicundus TaxID=77578 RepID=UPI004036963C
MAALQKIKSLIKARSVNKANITRLITHIKKHPDMDIDQLETRKMRLDGYYQSFENTQVEIEELAEEAELGDDQNIERERFDELFYECSDLISRKLQALKAKETLTKPATNTPESASGTSNLVIQQSNTLLPKIEIRPFDGNPIEWNSFYDTFQSLVHNDSKIPAVQKFYLLKNSLRGSVATIIEPLHASEENYLVAWELLKQRCDRPRQIVYAHLKSFFELPEISKDSPLSLRTLKENALMHVNALKALQLPVDSWDALLVYILTQKLDKLTRRSWERTLENAQMPKFAELIAFLGKQERGDEIEEFTVAKNKLGNHCNTDRHASRIEKPFKARAQAYIGTQQRPECTFCRGDHYIYACNKFLKLNVHDRIAAARDKRLCINCLRNNHITANCIASVCKKCNRKHNSLLHIDNYHTQSNNEKRPEAKAIPGSSNEVIQKSYAVTYDSEVLLGTARVKILDNNNRERECRILLDGCSQCNFISTRLAETLKLERDNIDLPFAGLGQLTTRAKYRVKTKIRSKANKFEAEVEFVALPTITSVLPSRQINRRTIAIPRNIKLADPEFDKPAEIDALIGTTLFYKLLSNGQIQLEDQSKLTLQKTLLGWIVVGEIGNLHYNVNPRACHLITSLDNQLTRFWEVEEIPGKRHYSTEELECEQLFTETTTRDSGGRYTVQLPFNERKNSLGQSHNMALNRFYALEKKLARNNALKQQYSEFLREYRDLGHMREITQHDNTHEGYYIPHHAVFKDEGLSTKIRVVFDASAKSSTNISLNNTLRVGPTIQDELIFIIMRFRLHNVVLAADIQKMYRQIKVQDSDAIYQKILWRENEHEAIRVFKLTTVTQGTAPAPFLAARTLHQLSSDERSKYPQAAAILKNDFYVDDLLSGAATVQEALKIKNQLVELLKLGGFQLHKWASNKPELIVESDNADASSSVCLNMQTRKLLGVHWNSIEDALIYSIKPLSNDKCVTKRNILSHIAQLFDPLGLLGPVIVIAKLIMQSLWKANLNWDESIPKALFTKWMNFKHELPILSQFKVPRQIIQVNSVDIQLHGFCDASERAYGACIYLRSVNNTGDCYVQLLCAKSRVAPVKTMTIPRLELCAAHLLSNLVKTVTEALRLTFAKIHLWSDSTIALHWIQASPHTLKTFVANRVAEIQVKTNINDWHHISTDDNPADDLSRGQNPCEFIRNTRWLLGPTWLAQNESQWKIRQLSEIVIPDQRVATALLVAGLGQNNLKHATLNKDYLQIKNDTFEQFSSITALNRFVALCRRAVANRRLENKIRGQYTARELQNAHWQIIKVIQYNHFSRDINCLKEGKELGAKSKLTCLNPFLDSTCVMRVGGRLTNAAMSYSRKYPILLPRNDHVTTLIMRHEHEKNWHAGVQATLNTIRHKYWPIDGKNKTRQIIRNCIRCSKLNPQLPEYIMGDLPKHRVTQSRPFANVGIDYCGPFSLKEKKFRNTGKVKSYVAVFVCFSTRAVHLELVTDLTTETCLEAVKRFCSRRGKPKTIYSDNATNFVGAKNEIMKVRAFFLDNKNQAKFAHYSLSEGIDWQFSPPRSPHFGGLWEAAVKSFKHHLYRTVGESMFTYEQFNTCIIEIEAILNSRPLTPVSSDPNDLIALTPAHFLIGDSLKSVPEVDLRELPINRLSMWQRIQQIKQHFWVRWHKEYLNQLRTRSKWHDGDGKGIAVGQLVTIREENLPPMHWRLGRIIAIHPGQDNVVRVVTVKTQDGVYKRCVKRLAPLPIDISTDNEV